MAWTTPKTDWETGELVAASDMNAIGENLAALRNPGSARYTTTEEIVANVAEFTDVDSTNTNMTITTNGGDVLVHFHGSVSRRNTSATQYVFFDVEIDGSRQGGVSGILKSPIDGYEHNVSFAYLVQNLEAGSHTLKLQWKENGGGNNSVALAPGAHFFVREI